MRSPTSRRWNVRQSRPRSPHSPAASRRRSSPPRRRRSRLTASGWMPPTGRVLLDTNIIIQLFADDAGVRLGVAHADAVFVPVIALGELFYGARQSGRGREP